MVKQGPLIWDGWSSYNYEIKSIVMFLYERGIQLAHTHCTKHLF